MNNKNAKHLSNGVFGFFCRSVIGVLSVSMLWIGSLQPTTAACTDSEVGACTIEVTAVIEDGCKIISPAEGSDGRVLFGTIDFGAHPITRRGSVQGLWNHSESLKLVCSETKNYSVTIDGGLHYGAGEEFKDSRYLSNGKHTISYRLLSGNLVTDAYLANVPRVFTAHKGVTTKVFPIRATAGVPGRFGTKSGGVYTDVLRVTISF